MLDLFAGCGGLTEGFHQFRPGGTHGPVFRSVGAVEWDPPAAASYAANFGAGSSRAQHFGPPEIHCRDIVGWVPRWSAGEIEVVIGGPPCQGFSGLNRNKVRAERNSLWQEFVRVVIELQPKVFVIENVDRFVRSVEFADLKARVGNGDLANYSLVPPPGAKDGETEWQLARRYLLNAADYGAIQARRRAIVIGVRTDTGIPVEAMRYPAPTHARGVSIVPEPLAVPGLSSERAPWRTVDDLFSATAVMPLTLTELPDRRHESSVQGVPEDLAGPFEMDELHITRNPAPISLARYRAIPAGGNRKDLRGRYVCRFEDGGSVIIEKVGQYRDADGALSVLGGFREVVDGVTTPRPWSVLALEVPQASRSVRRGINAVVRQGDGADGFGERAAVLEYLSTDAWDAHDAGAGDVMGRIRTGLPSVTIRTEFFKPEKGRYLHPTEDRPITHYEAARLQGFPDDFRWCGSKTEIAKQIGNAVPIPLGRKIAEAVYAYLRPSRAESEGGF